MTLVFMLLVVIETLGYFAGCLCSFLGRGLFSAGHPFIFLSNNLRIHEEYQFPT